MAKTQITKRGTGQFTVDIARFIKKSGIASDVVLRKVALDALLVCLYRSPVDTGRFRGSWRVGIGARDTSVAPAPDPNQTAVKYANRDAASGDAMVHMQVLNSLNFKDGVAIYISNALPYALPLEYGHSKQETTGIVRNAVLEVAADLKRL